MPTALEVLIDLAKDSEGCKLTAYKCPAGVWTIGWGSTGMGIIRGTVWSQEQADNSLTSDCRKALEEALLASPILRDQSVYKQAAIADAIYNLGSGNYDKSTLKKRVDAAEWGKAKTELRRWVNGGGKVLKGLVIRREKECELLDKI
jgi:lysozyme